MHRSNNGEVIVDCPMPSFVSPSTMGSVRLVVGFTTKPNPVINILY
jgi:hypothetical protein